MNELVYTLAMRHRYERIDGRNREQWQYTVIQKHTADRNIGHQKIYIHTLTKKKNLQKDKSVCQRWELNASTLTFTWRTKFMVEWKREKNTNTYEKKSATSATNTQTVFRTLCWRRRRKKNQITTLIQFENLAHFNGVESEQIVWFCVGFVSVPRHDRQSGSAPFFRESNTLFQISHSFTNTYIVKRAKRSRVHNTSRVNAFHAIHFYMSPWLINVGVIVVIVCRIKTRFTTDDKQSKSKRGKHEQREKWKKERKNEWKKEISNWLQVLACIPTLNWIMILIWIEC